MRVEIEFAAWISHRLGCGMRPLKWRVEAMAGEDVAVIFTRLAADDGFRREVFDPEQRQLHEAITVAVNGRLLGETAGLRHVLAEGDRLTLIMALAGGAPRGDRG